MPVRAPDVRGRQCRLMILTIHHAKPCAAVPVTDFATLPSDPQTISDIVLGVDHCRYNTRSQTLGEVDDLFY